MTLQQLRYVVQVAADGTFSAAAKRLFITQPSLTAAVRELERELGKHLLQHDKKNVVLTDAGRQLLPYARKMVELENDAKDDLNTLVNF